MFGCLRLCAQPPPEGAERTNKYRSVLYRRMPTSNKMTRIKTTVPIPMYMCDLRFEGLLRNDVALDDARAASSAEPAPRRPEDEREQRADRADDHQDPTNRHQIDAVDGFRHGERKHCANRHEEETDAESHCDSPS